MRFVSESVQPARKELLANASFQISQSPTVVSSPPGPTTLSNGMLSRQPSVARLYA
jgi:hypothetical protein